MATVPATYRIIVYSRTGPIIDRTFPFPARRQDLASEAAFERAGLDAGNRFAIPLIRAAEPEWTCCGCGRAVHDYSAVADGAVHDYMFPICGVSSCGEAADNLRKGVPELRGWRRGITPLYGCASCGKMSAKEGGEMKRCSRCRAAHYCSKECQTAHWPQHKTVCRDS
ncbi:hypothetical protein DFJ74DRAFT_705418 [Hyaloraphidium curvatum]|nr:hypothetical protein DFJ74DRAFT_705418 [Hyaloraphidium curvatum]